MPLTAKTFHNDQFDIDASSSKHLKELIELIHKDRYVEPGRALNHAKEGLNLARQLKDKAAEGDLKMIIGNIYSNQGKYVEASTQYNRAMDIYRQMPESFKRLANAENALGTICLLSGARTKALKHFYKALRFNEPTLKVTVYVNMASVYTMSGQYEQALKFLHKALPIAQAQKQDYYVTAILANIGNNYLEQNQLQEAVSYTQKALLIIKLSNKFVYLRSVCLINLGRIYFLLDDFDKSYQYFKESLRLSKNNQFLHNVAYSLMYLSKIPLAEGNEEGFFYYHEQAVNSIQSLGYEELQIETLRNLQEFYESKANYFEANKVLKQIIELKDKISISENDQQLSDLLHEKEEVIQLLEQKNKSITMENDNLEQSQQELAQCAYFIAHNLKEPLRTISSFSTLLSRQFEDHPAENAREYAAFLQQGTHKIDELLKDFLRYVDLNRHETNLEMVNTEKTAHHIIENYQEWIDQEEANIQLHLLPTLYMDKKHFYLLFENLIQNALKFKSKEYCNIEIGANDQGDHYLFFVKDDGIGIDAAYHSKIFELFNQLDRNNFKGTGLGLAICKKIVHKYNGNIWVESELGQGCTFYFTIEKKQP